MLQFLNTAILSKCCEYDIMIIHVEYHFWEFVIFDIFLFTLLLTPMMAIRQQILTISRLFCVINFLAVINQSLITPSEWPVYCIIFMFLLHTQGETLIKNLSIHLSIYLSMQASVVYHNLLTDCPLIVVLVRLCGNVIDLCMGLIVMFATYIVNI